ncbi:flagellar biosynthetic protein FliQ [Paenibacillus sp. TRM 82003]|uniref:flagellar biosynthetic protein FliQ n=1 Tax=Kineococcus sp. TRM81007 TaxID=2925831 RepID=UPI001F59937C|nr:flagellar biosynthetic protein FliQ [Kineococcus sp. TRM81007]MCI2240596.1 flagellar biosynthetic protein FliQ [Kineococcus sp. TRM81007]MCI3925482.1 flagellar biosynthetic protein FliQ [Paenibacillus sp. TRM 82003]
MSDVTVIHLGMTALVLAAKLSAPLLLTALAVGFGISLFQSVTQLQEQTIAFVPKALAVGIAIVVCGKWMLHELTAFTTSLYGQIPDLVSGG